MSLFSIQGTVTAAGQSQFDNALTIYAYLEITEASGRRVSIDKVAVCNDVSASLRLGQSGEIFIDRIFHYSKTYRCQLWGIKADGIATLDSIDIRKRVSSGQFLLGIMLISVFGLGLLIAAPALIRILTLSSVDRRKMFHGSDPAEAQRLNQQRVVRI
jgi:hypothetical protein